MAIEALIFLQVVLLPIQLIIWWSFYQENRRREALFAETMRALGILTFFGKRRNK